MFAVELGFSPDPARLGARPAHRDRLRALHERGVLRMAGPYADDSGALLIFDLGTLEQLQAVLDADPYYAGSWITRVDIHEWSLLFG